LPDESNDFQAVNKLQKIQRNGFGELKLPWPIIWCKKKARRRLPGAGSTILAMMSMCP
jgi:hypothetical protein